MAALCCGFVFGCWCVELVELDDAVDEEVAEVISGVGVEVGDGGGFFFLLDFDFFTFLVEGRFLLVIVLDEMTSMDGVEEVCSFWSPCEFCEVVAYASTTVLFAFALKNAPNMFWFLFDVFDADEWRPEKLKKLKIENEESLANYFIKGLLEGQSFLKKNHQMLASFVQDYVGISNSNPNSSQDQTTATPITSTSTSSSSASSDNTSCTGTSLCITGLSKELEAKDLHEHFSSCGTIISILNKFGYEAEKKYKGICFINFKTEKEAKAALKLDKTTIGGRWIKVRSGVPRGSKKATGSTRLMVGNLPYDPQPTQDEVGALFKTTGNVISVKFATDGDRKEGEFRGFCFVIFNGQLNAKEARKLDRTTHFGRRLSVKVIGNPDANKHRKTLPTQLSMEEKLFAVYQERRKLQGTAEGEQIKPKWAENPTESTTSTSSISTTSNTTTTSSSSSFSTSSSSTEPKKKKAYVHWADHKDLMDIKNKFIENGKELAKFRPSRKIDNKVICVKCIFHGLDLCVQCEGEIGVKIQRKYLRHATKEEILQVYPDFNTVLLDYDGKLKIEKKKMPNEESSSGSDSSGGSSSSDSGSSSDGSDSDSDSDDEEESIEQKKRKAKDDGDQKKKKKKK